MTSAIPGEDQLHYYKALGVCGERVELFFSTLPAEDIPPQNYKVRDLDV